jgi:filamentous hemagglutinin family protein
VNSGATNRLGLFAICSIFGTLPQIATAQHITVDGRLSPAQTLVGPNYWIGANLGKQMGNNLFHSFSKFGLATNETTTFTGPSTVNNIIGRVTGSSMSSIDGKIQSNIAGANLYLINPNGIVFGPNATVNVSGSFHASSADYIKMSDGSRFQATNPSGSTLSFAPPTAFGFLNATPGQITVNGGPLVNRLPQTKIAVGSGRTLDLIGGPVTIDGGVNGQVLSAPSGTIRVTSVAGPGEVPAAKSTGSKPTVASYGSVNITNNSKLDVTDGGSVFIRAGRLTIDGGSEINGDNSGSNAGGRLVLRADGKITISGGATVHADTLRLGKADDISVKSGSLSMSSSTAEIRSTTTGPGDGGDISAKIAGALSIDGGAGIRTKSQGSTGNPGKITINASSLSLTNSAEISNLNSESAKSGSVFVNTGTLSIENSGKISSNTSGSGTGGDISVNATTATIRDVDSEISAGTSGRGDAGTVQVSVLGNLSIVGPPSNSTFSPDIIHFIGIGTVANPGSTGNAGNVFVSAGILSIAGLVGEVSSSALNSGAAGKVSVDVAGPLSIAGPRGSFPTGIVAAAFQGGTGNAGDVAVRAGSLSIADEGEISATSAGIGVGGSVMVMTPGPLLLTSGAQIAASALATQSGQGGSVTVDAGSLTVRGGAQIASTTAGLGKGGDVGVKIAGNVNLSGTAADGSASGISAAALPRSVGDAGQVVLRAGGAIALSGGAEVGSSTAGAGKGGTVQVVAEGALTLSDSGSAIVASATSTARGDAGSVGVMARQITIAGGAEIASSTAGPGKGGDVSVTVANGVTLSGAGPTGASRITTSAELGSSGDAGQVALQAGGPIALSGGAEVASSTAGFGNGGSVTVTTPVALLLDGMGVGGTRIAASADQGSRGGAGLLTVNAGSLTVQGGAQIASSTAGPGKGGDVSVMVANDVSLLGAGPAGVSGITTSAEPGSRGDAGQVALQAGGAIALSGGAEVASSTAGFGNGGSVAVTTPAALLLDGMGVGGTRIAASADQGSRGGAGSLTVNVGSLTVQGGAQIASSTAGPGKGGDVSVMVANGVSLLGAGPAGVSRITTSAEPGSGGDAGQVVLTAGGAIALSGGAEVASSTDGAGKGGTVQVTAHGPLSLSDPFSGIVALATKTASGDAGSVMAQAPQITIASGAQIASTTEGTGIGGSVDVTTPGALVLDGAGVANTQIAASAIGTASGPGGPVTVNAGSLTIRGGAQIASSTAGPGKGGDVSVNVASDIALADPGSQITAQSTGSGDAGSINLSAVRLLMNNGAAISTEAETSTASARNITLNVRDFLYLVSSKITTSVSNKTGSGGNIEIDPQFVILNHSRIIAEAIEGNGGNITINTGEYIKSADSIVDASSQLGIPGRIEITGPRVDVNGALVVLSSELRSAAEVLRHSCAAQAAQPQSSLVEAGRGGLPQDPEATLPALYFAGRDVNPNPQATAGSTEAKSALQTRAYLTMHCG